MLKALSKVDDNGEFLNIVFHYIHHLLLGEILLIFSLILNAALAYTPSDSVHIGIEPVRTYYSQRAHQKRMKHHPQWRAFAEAEGLGWDVVFDQETTLPYRAWGPGIDVGEIGSAEDAISTTIAFLSRNPTLLGSKGKLGEASAAYDAALDAWYVSFEQQISLSHPAIIM